MSMNEPRKDVGATIPREGRHPRAVRHEKPEVVEKPKRGARPPVNGQKEQKNKQKPANRKNAGKQPSRLRVRLMTIGAVLLCAVILFLIVFGIVNLLGKQTRQQQEIALLQQKLAAAEAEAKKTPQPVFTPTPTLTPAPTPTQEPETTATPLPKPDGMSSSVGGATGSTTGETKIEINLRYAVRDTIHEDGGHMQWGDPKYANGKGWTDDTGKYRIVDDGAVIQVYLSGSKLIKYTENPKGRASLPSPSKLKKHFVGKATQGKGCFDSLSSTIPEEENLVNIPEDARKLILASLRHRAEDDRWYIAVKGSTGGNSGGTKSTPAPTQAPTTAPTPAPTPTPSHNPNPTPDPKTPAPTATPTATLPPFEPTGTPRPTHYSKPTPDPKTPAPTATPTATLPPFEPKVTPKPTHYSNPTPDLNTPAPTKTPKPTSTATEPLPPFSQTSTPKPSATPKPTHFSNPPLDSASVPTNVPGHGSTVALTATVEPTVGTGEGVPTSDTDLPGFEKTSKGISFSSIPLDEDDASGTVTTDSLPNM